MRMIESFWSRIVRPFATRGREIGEPESEETLVL
jgi:hypothetical protein